MRRLLPLILAFLGCSYSWAQTPTLVQDVNTPNSGHYAADTWTSASGCPSTANRYCAALAEPAAATGNVVLVGVFSGNSSAGTVTDDKSDTCALRDHATDSSGNTIEAWSCTVTAGARVFTYAPSNSNGGYISVHLTEIYNASAYDTSNCNTATSASTSIAAGSITPAASGDILWQWAAMSTITTGGNVSTEFSPSTQTNFAAVQETSSLNDGVAAEMGIYSSTTAINPTMSGQSEKWDSCAIAFKAGSAGGAPASSFRIIHMLHEAEPIGMSSPQNVEFAATGNLIIISALGGGTTVGSVTSTPANTWSTTGSVCSYGGSYSQIIYSGNASVSGTMSLSIPFTGTSEGGTFIIYDVTGAAASSFDNDSGCLSGDLTKESSTLTICSSCFSPGHVNDLVIGNMGQDYCTAVGMTTPSGSLFDATVYNGNNNDGPQNVDQNNGWFHDYPGSTSAITATFSESCADEAQGAWAGRLAAFKSAGLQPTAPTALTGSVVPQ